MHKTLEKQLRAQFYRGNRGVFALAVFAALAGGTLNLIVTWLMQQLIDAASGLPGALPLGQLAWITGGFILLCAALMLAVNTMLVTLVPLRLQNTGRISALSGLLNSATYAGSTLSGYGMGLLLERSGWPAALLGLCAGALAASLLCAAAARGWKRLRG